MAKQYKYYACCKDASGNGVTCAGRDIMEEAYKDLVSNENEREMEGE